LAALAVPVETAIEVRAMSQAEVEVLRGSLLPLDAAYKSLRLEHAQKAIESDPTWPGGHILRATLRLAEGDSAGAMHDLREATAAAPEDAGALLALGNLLLQTRDDAGELDEVAKKLAFMATTADAHLFLARYELSLGHPERAVKQAELSVAADSSCVNCFLAGALAFYRSRQLERAVRYQRTALNLAGERASDAMLGALKKYERALAGSGSGGS
jgi:Tfp pilus assembly protein PilF